MQAPTTTLDTATSTPTESQLAYRLAGLTAAALVPALFWVGIAAAVSHLAGVTMTTSALVLTGSAIALFLGAICAPIMLHPAR